MTTIANEILNQLGGSKFKAMTGAKNFVDGGDFLQFDLANNFAKDKINKIRIVLTNMDTYNVQFMNWNRQKLVITYVHEVNGIYADQLQEVFTRYTGLDTHL